MTNILSKIRKKVVRSSLYGQVFFPSMKENPITSSQKIVFVCGLHKSGTSALHSVMRRHKDVSGISGSGFPEDEGQFIQDVYTPDAEFGGPGLFAFRQPAEVCENPGEIHNRLLCKWAPYFSNREAPVLVEKSPPNLLRMKWLETVFPEAYFIVVIRHPLAVSLATQKWSNTSMVELLTHWWVAHTRGLSDYRKLKRAYIVRYEDLVSDSSFLEQIQKFLGMDSPFESGVLKDQNQKYFERWETMCDEDRKMVEHLGAMLLQESFFQQLGYSLREPYVEPSHLALDKGSNAP